MINIGQSLTIYLQMLPRSSLPAQEPGEASKYWQRIQDFNKNFQPSDAYFHEGHSLTIYNQTWYQERDSGKDN